MYVQRVNRPGGDWRRRKGREGEAQECRQYPEAARGGASVAVDAVEPEDVAAGVHLHVVSLGRRPDPEPRVVEPATRNTPVRKKSTRLNLRAHTPSRHKRRPVDQHHLPCLGGEADAAEREVDRAEAPAVAAGVVPPQRRQVALLRPAGVARELAAHREDAGGGGERRQREEEGHEEGGGAGRRHLDSNSVAPGWDG
jgi:hypothetical protein